MLLCVSGALERVSQKTISADCNEIFSGILDHFRAISAVSSIFLPSGNNMVSILAAMFAPF